VLGQLRNILPDNSGPDRTVLLSGLIESDDAAVIRHDDSTALVLTLDFFTPIVDNPYDFGAIAAANALSDIYAMGARPIAALNICCMPDEIITDIFPLILKGGAEKVAQAGAFLAGGHSVRDNEPKYGLSVLGIVHPDHIWEKRGARAGDIFYLTKPLGTGLITTALKVDMVNNEDLENAVKWMKRLNRDSADFFRPFFPKACTDVTGFGLTGHLLEIADKSNIGIEVFIQSLPILSGARECAQEDLYPAGTCHNQRNYHKKIILKNVFEEMNLLINTPETSGGLIIAVDKKYERAIQKKSSETGHKIWKIGKAVTGSGLIISGD
jgi:selenide,water dikinase